MPSLSNPTFAVFLIALGMALIPLNDAGVKVLGEDLPLMQVLAIRSLIGMAVFFFIPTAVPELARLSLLTWVKLLGRGTLLVGSMVCYFMGLVEIPLGLMSAIFFVLPLLISLLSVPFLGERLGIWRVLAIILGFAGVVLISKPWQGGEFALGWSVLYPIGSAFFYAMYQIVTRMMRDEAGNTAMAAVQQIVYFSYGLGIGLVLAVLPLENSSNDPTLQFLFRDWALPSLTHWWILLVCSATQLFLSFAASNAYRVAEAGHVAPFEYTALPFSVFWGGVFWGQWPGLIEVGGMALIIGAGLLTLFRENVKDEGVVTTSPMRPGAAMATDPYVPDHPAGEWDAIEDQEDQEPQEPTLAPANEPRIDPPFDNPLRQDSVPDHQPPVDKAP